MFCCNNKYSRQTPHSNSDVNDERWKTSAFTSLILRWVDTVPCNFLFVHKSFTFTRATSSLYFETVANSVSLDRGFWHATLYATDVHHVEYESLSAFVLNWTSTVVAFHLEQAYRHCRKEIVLYFWVDSGQKQIENATLSIILDSRVTQTDLHQLTSQVIVIHFRNIRLN